MRKIVIGLVGAGGFGSEVMPIIQDEIFEGFKGQGSLCFIDEDENKKAFMDRDVVSIPKFLELEASEKYFNVAIANPKIRARLSKELINKGINVLDIISKDSTFLHNIRLSRGSIVFPNVVITSNVKIGEFFHSYHNVSIAHDCVLGDYVTIAPGALINGNVNIGNHVYIGSGAVIRQGITIGKDSFIGMGAVVIEDVPPQTTVVGNPARVIERKVNEK